MCGRNPFLVAGLVLVGVALAAETAQADTYRDKVHNFSVELPTAWEPISPQLLKAINAYAELAYPGLDISYVAGFRPRSDKREPLPYILVQVDTEITQGISFDDFAKEIDGDYRAAVERHEREYQLRLHRRLIHTKPSFNKERKRFRTLPPEGSYPPDDSFFYSGPSGTEQQTLWSGSYGYLGQDKLVILHTVGGYGLPRPYSEVLVKICDSFKFEEPEQASDNRSQWERMVMTPTGEIARPVLIGGAVGLGVLVLGGLSMMQQRLKTRRGQPWG